MTDTYYDFAIIGAGILGSNLAYQLSLAYPQKSIVIFEMNQVGSGCTGYAGAIASPLISSSKQRLASGFCKHWYSEYQVKEKSAFIRHLPCIIVSNHEADNVQSRCENSISTASSTVPPWLTITDTIHLYQGGMAIHANARPLCLELLSKCKSIDIFEGTKIIKVNQKNKCWSLTTSDSRKVNCEQLFTATGPWLDHYHDMVTKEPYALPGEHNIRRKKIVSYIVEQASSESDSLIYFIDDSAFLLPDPTNQRWIMSITSEKWDCLPISNNLYANEAELELAKAILGRYCPDLVRQLRGARVHCDGYSVDRMPAAVQMLDKHIRLAGGSGSGFRYAPQVVSDAISLLNNR